MFSYNGEKQVAVAFLGIRQPCGHRGSERALCKPSLAKVGVF
ncbi:hypothetical protein AtDm6_1899 [Acetobacter tropicalis]|uniref:Uncharacterized protein n=1 Tax=Acetobacter tropicalis TaxID=104102 RepID=A0A094YLU4_9PROT|nr:hypothetical protein AtDm6_1899 [Acetobacter tropicalis]